MAAAVEEEHHQKPTADNADSEENDDYDEIDEDEEEFEEEEEEQPLSKEAKWQSERAQMDKVLRRISTEVVHVRVHDVLIKGNTKTKDSLIEAELAELRNVSNMRDLIKAATIANARLRHLEIFDSVSITLDSGPPELPGTTNVVVELVEAKNPLSGDFGIFSKPEARSWSLEGSLKLKNLFGYADVLDGSIAYGWNQTSELSAGISLPRFKRLATPIMARVGLLSQDWLKFSSYKERALSLSLGLLSSKKHDLSYNLSWRTLSDPSQMASSTVRRQLGHGLLSALKYSFKIDKRNSPLRPTSGYAFVSTTQIGGLVPDNRSTRFLRQEFDLRYAIPLGFSRAAINLGISSGVVFPWGSGFMNMPTFLPERFYLGGNSSPVCGLGGPTSLFGFKSRGVGPAESRRRKVNNGEDESVEELDYVGGDLAVTAFADISFDLPLKVLRDAGIHGHAFACTGSLNKLTENAYKDLSLQRFKESFRSSAGFGLIVPTKLFRMEVNYCYILKQHENDRGKTGLQFNFSSPL